MEAVYAFVHFVSIVFVYQIVLRLQLPPLFWLPIIGNKFKFSIVFFISAAFFIRLLYPGSLQDKALINLRGAILGSVLHVTLLWGMLM
jgi:hypothetical protein